MPVLQYDLSVVGLKQVESALASIEKRFTQHSAKIMSTTARAANAPAVRAVAKQSSPTAPKLSQELRDMGRGYKQLAQVGMTAERQRHREAMRNIQAEQRAAQKAQREFRARVGSGLSQVGRSVGGVGKAALAVTGIGGGALIASRLGSAISLERQQRELAVAGSGQMSLGGLRSTIKNTSIATGASQEDVTQGLREYVSATGNLGEAAQAIQSFATIAQAAGASVSDVSKAGAYLTKSMGISAKELPEALSKLYFQGKKGAFELKDIASAIPALGAQASNLGMKGMAGMTTLGGLAQIAQTGTGNAAEAQTALQSLFKQMVDKAGDVQSGKAFGKKVEVFEHGDPTKAMHDVPQVLANIIAASRGDVTKLNEFADIRGSKALNPLVGAYKSAAESTKGSDAQKIEAGRQAVLKMIQDNADAQGTYADVQRDASQVMESFSAQLEVLNTRLTDIANSELVPALKKLGPPIEKLIPFIAQATEVFAKLLGFFAENPFAHLGELVLGKVVFDLEKAAIGDAVKKKLLDLMTSNGGNAGGSAADAAADAASAASGKGKKASRFGRLASALRFVPFAGALADMAGEYLGNEAGASLDKYGGAYRGALSTETDIMRGGMSQEQLSARRDELRAQAQSLMDNGPTTADKIAYSLPGSTETAQQAHDKALGELKLAIGQLNAAIKDNTSATNGTALNRTNSPAVPKGAG